MFENEKKKSAASCTRSWKKNEKHTQKNGGKKKKELHQKQESKELREGSLTNNFLVGIYGLRRLKGGKIRRACPPKWASMFIIYNSDCYHVLLVEEVDSSRQWSKPVTQVTKKHEMFTAVIHKDANHTHSYFPQLAARVP